MEIPSLSQIAMALGTVLPEESEIWAGVKARSDMDSLTIEDWGHLQRALQLLARGTLPFRQGDPQKKPVVRVSESKHVLVKRRVARLPKLFGLSPEKEKITFLSQWLGATDHTLAAMRWHHGSNTTFVANAAAENRRNPMAASLQYYTSALPGNPQPLHESLQYYLGVHPLLRGHYVDALITIDQFLGKVESLQKEAWTEEDVTSWNQNVAGNSMTGKSALSNMESMFHLFNSDLYELLTDNEGSWHTYYESVQKELWHGDQPVKTYRIHINMTTINEMTPDGLFGDVYLDIVYAFLAKKFGRENVVRNPESTSFLVTGPSAQKIEKGLLGFSQTIKTQLLTHEMVKNHAKKDELAQTFTPQVIAAEKTISPKEVLRYAIIKPEDLQTFSPLIDRVVFADDASGREAFWSVLSFESQRELLASTYTISLESVRATGDRNLQLMAEALVLKAVMEMNRELASMTTFFEKERANIHAGYSKSVFTTRDLPNPETQPALFSKWVSMKNSGVGFVGPGQYVPEEYLSPSGERRVSTPTSVGGHSDRVSAGSSEEVRHWIGMFPRFGRIYGQLSHAVPSRAREGNLSQRFLGAWQRVVKTSPADSDFESRLSEVRSLAISLKESYIEVYRSAVQNPRHSWALKGSEYIKVLRGGMDALVELNPPITEIAAARNVYLGAMEFDSLKAYLAAHPSTEPNDEKVMQAWNMPFIVAERMKMAPPTLVPGKGDHVTFSFGSHNTLGDAIDPKEYILQIQQGIADLYRGEPFQDFKKVQYYQIVFHSSQKMDELMTPYQIQQLSKRFKLNAEIRFHEVGTNQYVLEFPKEDRLGRVIDSENIIRVVEEGGDGFLRHDSVNVENVRVKIWQKKSRMAETFYFGHQTLLGYKPYMKDGLTVTMALVDHKSLRSPEDIVQFNTRKNDLDLALEQAKYMNGLRKQGFIDARSSDQSIVSAGESGGSEGSGSASGDPAGGGGVGGVGSAGPAILNENGPAANVDNPVVDLSNVRDQSAVRGFKAGRDSRRGRSLNAFGRQGHRMAAHSAQVGLSRVNKMV